MISFLLNERSLFAQMYKSLQNEWHHLFHTPLSVVFLSYTILDFVIDFD